MITAKKAKTFTKNSGIYCGALSHYRNDIDKHIAFSISKGDFDVFYESSELHQNESELSKMIFKELENLGYTVYPQYKIKGVYGIYINWYDENQ